MALNSIGVSKTIPTISSEFNYQNYSKRRHSNKLSTAEVKLDHQQGTDVKCSTFKMRMQA
jgi:hypothetical protein